MNPFRFLAVMAMFVIPACVSRELNTKRDVGVQWWEDPCRVEVYDGPDLACRVRSPNPCVVVPKAPAAPVVVPAPVPET